MRKDLAIIENMPTDKKVPELQIPFKVRPAFAARKMCHHTWDARINGDSGSIRTMPCVNRVSVLERVTTARHQRVLAARWCTQNARDGHTRRCA
jgi:hypothetical protein